MASGFGGSKVPSGSPPSYTPAKRRLLIIYIHGFMGNETSFQSFPAHLHNLLVVTMEDLQYTVHTKVYPKFKTRHHITVATEDFSAWLSAFENDDTDVVLLGHSMGGILAAEVVLLQDNRGNRRHRILGIITFDSPFLGMHPGVVSAGLGSLFRTEPKSPPPSGGENAVYGGGAASASVSSLSTVDEFFDKRPARNFTVVESKQEGTWGSALKFINKHQWHLTAATGQYLLSHLEFGGCLADPIGLHNRYNAIRRLEDQHRPPPRVRFLNYYTSSTGRNSAVPEPAPAAPLPEHSFELADSTEHMLQTDLNSANDDPLSLQVRGSDPMSDVESFETIKTTDTPPAPAPHGSDGGGESDGDRGDDDTPPPPLPPERPAEFDYSLIPDSSVRLAAEQAAAKLLKAWEKRMKGYEKELEKFRKREAKDAATAENTHQRQEKARLKKEQERMQAEEKRMNATSLHSHTPSPPPPPPPPPPPRRMQQGENVKERKENRRPKRERKFCLLPTDKSDKCWVKVEMTGVDEVGAHCGLFFLGEVYERLVGDVAGRLEEWVGEERSRRMVESEVSGLA